MNPVILIPARRASTRLPDKPLLLIGGAPMIVQVWRCVRMAGLPAIVACDSHEIKEAVERAGGQAVLTDPDLPSGSDRIWQALQAVDPDGAYDVVVNVQGDMPTLDADVVRDVVALLEDERFDITTAASRITDNEEITDSAVVKAVFSANGMAEDFSRMAQGPGPHYHHIGIYAYRRPVLERFVSLPPSAREKQHRLEQLRAMDDGMAIGVVVVDTVPLGVDTQATLQKARDWYEQQE
ncbi:MAG: 3-deoxy-manno-octulosonate cytidylyltransferase [Alphaproteobacteria bacterium]